MCDGDRLCHVATVRATASLVDIPRHQGGEMPIEVDEAAQIRSVEMTMLARFAGRVSEDVVHAEVQMAASMLYGDARVRNFLPVLVERRVTERLRVVAMAATAD
jgi:hypothetical protein